MKQIFNWTIGSFFRTIGRTIALLVLGALLYFIVSSNDIRLTDLFVLKVNASTYEVGGANFYFNGSSTALNYNTYFDMFEKTILNASDSVYYFSMVQGALVDATQGPQPPGGANIAIFRGMFNLSSWTNYNITCINEDGTYHYCDEWKINNQYNFSITLGQYDGGYPTSTCYLSNDAYTMTENGVLFTARCPIYQRTTRLQYVRFNLGGYGVGGEDLELGIYLEGYEIDNNSAIINAQNNTTNSINQQTQQQQQQHEEMMNDTTTDAEDEAADFFSDFDVPDVGGLSAIITAPLNTIQNLLSNSCSNLVLPLPFVNQNLTLPCLGSIYNQHFGAFFTLYQTIILAIVSYRCIRSIYFDIHGFTDPNDDRIEVMDL